ncbi:hypothetical protein ABPG72_019794 [Tetrahymena utriculariae]
MSKQISLFAKGIIVGLKLVGTLEERIADILQDEGIPCDRSTISKIWKKYKEQGIYEDQRQYKSGRPQSLDEQDIKKNIYLIIISINCYCQLIIPLEKKIGSEPKGDSVLLIYTFYQKQRKERVQNNIEIQVLSNMKPQSSTPISQLERGIVIGLKISSTTNLNVQKILEENKISISLQSISRIWSQNQQEYVFYRKKDV